MRSALILLTCSTIASGCGARPDARKTDPSARAIIGGAPVVIPSDTAKPDTSEATHDRANQARNAMIGSYALISAGMILPNPRLMAPFYDANSSFMTPDVTAMGLSQISNAAIAFARRASLKDFQRASRTIVFLRDSVVSDSGYYTMISQRDGQPSHTQVGVYATKWRMQPAPKDWTVISDRLYPPAEQKPAKRP